MTRRLKKMTKMTQEKTKKKNQLGRDFQYTYLNFIKL